MALFDVSNFPTAKRFVDAALSNKYSVILYAGTVRSGKSFNALGAITLLSRLYPGSRSAIVRRDREVLVKNTLPTCMKVFPSNYLKLVNATSYEWEADNKSYGHEHNSKIMFMGENIDKDKELQRFDGFEVNFVLADQIEELNERTFHKLIERVGSYMIPGIPLDKQPKPLILATANPTNNWIRRIFYDRYKNGALPDDWLFIEGSISDNPHISEGYKENLEQLRLLSPSEYARRVKGDWNYADESNNLFLIDAINDSFETDYVDRGKKYISADIAMQGADKLVLIVWDGLRVERIEEHAKTDGKDVERLIKSLATSYNVPVRHIVYDADGMGSYLKGYLRGAKAFVNNSRAENKENFENLKTQCYYHLAQKIDNREIYINCDSFQREQIAQELQAIKRRDSDKDGKLKISRKEEIKKAIGRSPDYADALAMRMYFTKEIKPRERVSVSC